ncbi:MAG: hypothetical protein JSV66_08595 [Trueperaceae bacterium]|nr:MAG: hypothetical protein JSV66_08595 [Trueperaceae bacterium]
MRANPLKEILERGDSVLNGWLHIPSSYSAEAMAHQGFDSLTIDLQHGPVYFESALPMLQAISTTDTVPLCRVPWNEPGIIMKMLDVGCYGIICPMINNRQEAEAFVGACRYPPAGYRSYGPNRVLLYAGPDYGAKANDTVLAIAMIETAEAMENLDAIMSVPGLDAVYVGPADLSQGLGGAPGADFEEGPVVGALEQILAAARRNGIAAGIHTLSSRYAQKMLAKGYQFVTVQSDLAMMKAQAQEVVKAFKGDERPPGDAKGPY